jgi:UDP-N-acetyl-D-glucosamine dehydrogenase
VIPVSSAEVAESAKLLENIFRAVNIALVNEMKVVLTDLGVDVWEVIDAASTKPFGFMPFYPGPGLGGHCIPIDPFYLTWKAKEVGRPVEFIELAGLVNHRMPAYVIDRLAEGLNDAGKPVRGARVLVVGLAYKANVGDVRESPSFELIELLRKRGAEVDYHDPHVPHTQPMRRHDLRMDSVALDERTIGSYDAVLISTAHAAVDYELLARNAKLVVDTRNAMAPWADVLAGRLVKA